MNAEKLPNILMLQRKSIRMFPGGISVGLYYSSELDQYITISNSTKAVTEEKETDNVSDSD